MLDDNKDQFNEAAINTFILRTDFVTTMQTSTGLPCNPPNLILCHLFLQTAFPHSTNRSRVRLVYPLPKHLSIPVTCQKQGRNHTYACGFPLHH